MYDPELRMDPILGDISSSLNSEVPGFYNIIF